MPKALIVDEFGICPYDHDATTMFFSLVLAKYEKAQHHLHIQLRHPEWGEVLRNTAIATPCSNRLHHGYVLNICGELHSITNAHARHFAAVPQEAHQSVSS